MTAQIIYAKGISKEQDRPLTEEEVGGVDTDCPFCDVISERTLESEHEQLEYFERYGLEEYEHHYNLRGSPREWECRLCGRELGEEYAVRNRLIYQSRKNQPKIKPLSIRNVTEA